MHNTFPHVDDQVILYYFHFRSSSILYIIMDYHKELKNLNWEKRKEGKVHIKITFDYIRKTNQLLLRN